MTIKELKELYNLSDRDIKVLIKEAEYAFRATGKSSYVAHQHPHGDIVFTKCINDPIVVNLNEE